MTPEGVFFCWQGGSERDFVNSAILTRNGAEMAEVFRSKWIPLEEAYFQHDAIPEKADLRL